MRQFVVLAIFACVCIPANGASAEKLLIVLSSKAQPFVEAAEACETRLRGEGVETERVEISILTSAQIKLITPRVIAIGGRASALLARDLPANTKLYYCMTPRPGKIGLTQRPNTSGISTETDLNDQLELMQRGTPAMKRIGALYRSSSASSSESIENMRSAIPSGIELIAVDLDSYKSESDGIKQLLRQDIDIVWTTPDASAYNQSMIKSLLLKSLRKDVPVFGFSHPLVEAGATFGIGINPADQGEQIAESLIKNALDIHQSADPLIAVNLIAANRIRVEFTKSFIRQAEVVYR